MRRGNEAIFVQWRNSASSGIYNGMQVVHKIEVYKVEVERGISWGIVSMDFNICTEKISRYLEEKYIRGLRDREIWIWISRELSGRTRREFGENNELAKIVELKQVEQDSRIMEEFIQKSGKREQIQRMSVSEKFRQSYIKKTHEDKKPFMKY